MDTTHKSAEGDFFASLDGLRGIAILAVVIFHTAYFNPASEFQKILSCLACSGWMGVPIFFVLSGFLISMTIFRSPQKFSWKNYAWRRFAKIYPPFLLSLLIFGTVFYFFKHQSEVLYSAIADALTVTNFSQKWSSLNITWSLVIEIHFYITLPIIFLFFRRITKRADVITFLLFLFVPAIIRFSTFLPESESFGNWIHNASVFPKALDNFALGILFTIIYLRKNSQAWIKQLAPIISTVGLFILFSAFLGYGFLQWLHYSTGGIHGKPSVFYIEIFKYWSGTGTFMLLFSVLIPKNHFVSIFLCWSPLTFLGLISYEWFLFHYHPTHWLTEFYGDANGDIWIYSMKTIVPFLGCLAFSAFIYFFYSAPILTWFKSKKTKDPSSTFSAPS